MARLDKLRIVNPVLTELAAGYKNATCVGTELFPVVPVEKEAAIIPKFGKEAFKLYKTSRAPGAKSNRVKHDPAETVDVVLREHDLTDPIDYREDEESLFNEQERAVNFTSDALDLQIEKEIADLVQDPSTYTADHKKAPSYSITTAARVSAVCAHSTSTVRLTARRSVVPPPVSSICAVSTMVMSSPSSLGARLPSPSSRTVW